MKKFGIVSRLLFLGIIIGFFSSCATCQASYRKNLTKSPKLEEANISYKKAIQWAEKGDCTTYPFEAKECYRKAESYLSDAIFKLGQLGHDNQIDDSEELYYCEELKIKIHANINATEKALLP
ncbi:MAG: hypothetical protein WC546_03710 [Candidatus Omnitrophota bacterium]|jgi:hypothetical protein